MKIFVSIKKKLVVLLSSLLIFLIIIFSIYFYPKIDEIVDNLVESKAQEIIIIGYELIELYYNQYQNGLIDEQTAKLQAINIINNLRIEDPDSYYWIHDYNHVIIIHPNPDIVGENLLFFEDPVGFRVVYEMNKLIQEKGEGIIYYHWEKPGEEKPIPKVSFIKGFDPWEIVIGRGIYIEDVQVFKRTIITSFIILSIFLLMFIIFLAFTSHKLLIKPIEFLFQISKKIISDDSEISIENTLIKKNDELGTISSSMINMIKELNNKKTELQATNQELEAMNEELSANNQELENNYETISILNKEIKENEHHIKAIINTIPDLLFVFDKKGTYIDIYTEDNDLLIDSKENLINNNNILKEFLNPKDYENFILAINKAIKNKTTETFKYQLAIKGKWTFFEARISSLNDNEVIALVRDITKTKLYEEELIQSKEKAEEASKAKTIFLSKVSHELRTPMIGILGGCELSEKTKDITEIREYINIILQSAKRLKAIIENILDLSKIEAKEISLYNEKFNLNETMKEIIKINELKIKEKQLKFNYINETEENLNIIGDKTKLSQIINNLTENAVKFTEKGSIEIKTKTQEISNNKIKLFFQIKDTGIGIKKGFNNKIFEPFEQQEKYITRKYGGSGLGLSIVKELVEKMEGKVYFESEEGAGSTFFVELIFEKF